MHGYIHRSNIATHDMQLAKAQQSRYTAPSMCAQDAQPIVRADTAHCVRGLRPLGVSRPASRPFNPRAGAAQLAPRYVANQ